MTGKRGDTPSSPTRRADHRALQEDSGTAENTTMFPAVALVLLLIMLAGFGTVSDRAPRA